MTSLNLTVGKTFDLSELEDNHIIQLGRGLVISKEDMLNTVGDYPVYSSSATGNGEFGRYGKYMFDDERITWSIDGGGRLFYRHKHCYSVTNVCGWLKVLNNLLSTKYVYYNLIYQWQFIKFDYTFKAHPSKIRDIYKIHYLNYDEQLKIVKQLDIVQQIIDLRTQQLSHFDELIKARFIEMFDTLDLSLQRNDWVRLADLGTIFTGTTPSTADPTNWDGNILWITPAEMTESSFIITDTVRKITEKAVKSKSLSLMPIGTVLLSTRAPIGKVGIVGKPMTCNQGFKNFYCPNKLNSIYLYVLLKNNSFYLNSIGTGTTFKEISKTVCGNIRIPLPPIELQNEFAGFVKLIDKSKFAVQQAKENAQLLFDSLMQKYFG